MKRKHVRTARNRRVGRQNKGNFLTNQRPTEEVLCPRCGKRMVVLTYSATKAWFACEYCPPPWRVGPPTYRKVYLR